MSKEVRVRGKEIEELAKKNNRKPTKTAVVVAVTAAMRVWKIGSLGAGKEAVCRRIRTGENNNAIRQIDCIVWEGGEGDSIWWKILRQIW